MLTLAHATPAAPDTPVTAATVIDHLKAAHGLVVPAPARFCVPPGRDLAALRLPLLLHADDQDEAVEAVPAAALRGRLTYQRVLAVLDATRFDVVTLPAAPGAHLMVCDDFRPGRAANTLATGLCGGPLVVGPALLGRYGLDFGTPPSPEGQT